MGGCNFGNVQPVNVPKCHGGKVYVFWIKNFQSGQNVSISKPVFIIPIRILLKPWTLSFKKETISAKPVSQLKWLGERKKLSFTFQEKPGFALFSTDLGHIFGSNIGEDFGVRLRGKKVTYQKNCQKRCRRTPLMIYTYTHLIKYNIIDDTNVPLLCFFRFFQEQKPGKICYRRYMSYQSFSKLQLKPLFDSFIDLGYTRDEVKFFWKLALFHSFWCIEKQTIFVSKEKDATRWLLQDKQRFHFQDVSVDSLEWDSVHLQKLFGGTTTFCLGRSLQLQNGKVMTRWILTCQKLQRLLNVQKSQDSCKERRKTNCEKTVG